MSRCVKVQLTYRAFNTRGGLRPGAGRPSLSGSQIQQPTAIHQARKAAIMERAHRRRLYTQSRRNQHREMLPKESLTGMHSKQCQNQFDRLQKALTDQIATLDLLVPEAGLKRYGVRKLCKEHSTD